MISKPKRFGKDLDYCYNYGDYWLISRKGIIYGRYDTYEDAKQVSDELRKHNWNKSELRNIQKELGVVPRSKFRKGVSGIRRVYKAKDSKYRQGYTWVYQYYDKELSKNIHISSVSLDVLEQKVRAKGLEWEEY